MVPEGVGKGKLERRRTGGSWQALVATPLEGKRPPPRGPTAQTAGYTVTEGSTGSAAGATDTADGNDGPSRAPGSPRWARIR
jgi:hypothetical protein